VCARFVGRSLYCIDLRAIYDAAHKFVLFLETSQTIGHPSGPSKIYVSITNN
jgi:hypothetical protein